MFEPGKHKIPYQWFKNESDKRMNAYVIRQPRPQQQNQAKVIRELAKHEMVSEETIAIRTRCELWLD